MRICAQSKDELRDDKQAECRHGEKQGIPPDLQSTIENLLTDPYQKQGGGTGFHKENRPWFHCAERERAKQEQTEDPVEQDGVGLLRALATMARAFAIGAHEIEST